MDIDAEQRRLSKYYSRLELLEATFDVIIKAYRKIFPRRLLWYKFVMTLVWGGLSIMITNPLWTLLIHGTVDTVSNWESGKFQDFVLSYLKSYDAAGLYIIMLGVLLFLLFKFCFGEAVLDRDYISTNGKDLTLRTLCEMTAKRKNVDIQSLNVPNHEWNRKLKPVQISGSGVRKFILDAIANVDGKLICGLKVRNYNNRFYVGRYF